VTRRLPATAERADVRGVPRPPEHCGHAEVRRRAASGELVEGAAERELGAKGIGRPYTVDGWRTRKELVYEAPGGERSGRRVRRGPPAPRALWPRGGAEARGERRAGGGRDRAA
jgi:hypothetical protein